MTASDTMSSSLRQALSAVTKGIFQITHNSFALIGLAVLFVVMALVARPELRQVGEGKLFGWLQERQHEVVGMVSDPVASDRATATDPKELPKQQAAVAYWLSKKYRVAPEPIGALVAEAYSVGAQVKIEPTLILAVMAIESRFNPFAQSHVGAQGLMQVMTKIHSDKYQSFGGHFAAFDPLANLRVGVKVLKDCIRMAGSVEGGLKYYVGAGNMDSDGGYAAKVMAEYARLQQVADGRPIRTLTPQVTPEATVTKVIDTPTAAEAAPATPAEPDNTATLAMG
ncbi:MAG TPA: lytic transglycosylase domain-containing protein [Rhodoferax sp.]|nr:lytic transglycosylase domain-containing protein [Rhodoferax sp.]